MKTTIKANDTGVVFTDVLTIGGIPYNLTGATVKFIIAPTYNEAGISLDATVTDAAAGTVSYSVGTGFPTTPGTYLQEWEVTKDGKVLTFPSNGWNKVEIKPDLNKA